MTQSQELQLFRIHTMNSSQAKYQQVTENPNSHSKNDYYPVQIGDTYHNRYTVVRELGSGYFSTVWLCTDQHHNTHVALKIVRSAPSFTQAARREIQLLKRVRNGSRKAKLTRLLDYFDISGANDTHVCMVLEVLGDDLLKLIVRSGYKGIPLTHVKIIIRNVLEALDYLHTTCRIIHTDIKPENVCVNLTEQSELSATVTDLGNACWMDSHVTESIQTRAYRCPEVILGAGFKANADVWSTACMAFELATGRELFEAHSGANYTRDEHHLALVIELVGEVPKEVLHVGRRTRKFFTQQGRLRHFSEVKPCGLFDVLTERYEWDGHEAREFANFLRPMLAIDPDIRYSANDCLRHEWLKI